MGNGNTRHSRQVPEERQYAFDENINHKAEYDILENTEVYHIRLMLLSGTARISFIHYLKRNISAENLTIFKEVDLMRKKKSEFETGNLMDSLQSFYSGDSPRRTHSSSPITSYHQSPRQHIIASSTHQEDISVTEGCSIHKDSSLSSHGNSKPYSPRRSSRHSLSSITFSNIIDESVSCEINDPYTYSKIPFGNTSLLSSPNKPRNIINNTIDYNSSSGDSNNHNGHNNGSLTVDLSNFNNTLSQLFSNGNMSTLASFELVQSEIFVLFALDTYPRYIISNEYREWCSLEILRTRHRQQLQHSSAVNHILENGEYRDIQRLLAVRRSVSSDNVALQTDSTELCERILAHLDDNRVRTVLSSSTWMMTLLHCLSTLPIAVTILKATKDITPSASSHFFPIIYANKLFLSMSGYTLNELLGCNIQIFHKHQQQHQHHDSNHRNTVQQFQKIMCDLNSNSKFDVLVNHYKKDHTFYKSRVFFKPMFDSNNDHMFTYAVHYNVTDQGISPSKIRPVQQLIDLLPHVIPAGSNMSGVYGQHQQQRQHQEGVDTSWS
eukprot:gene9151-18960_t